MPKQKQELQKELKLHHQPQNRCVFYHAVIDRLCLTSSPLSRFTCELLLAAIPNTFLQILQLVFHLLVLSLRLLTLPPGGRTHADTEENEHTNVSLRLRVSVNM